MKNRFESLPFKCDLQRYTAGPWKPPPQGWSSSPANSWGAGGASVSWETEMEPVAAAPGGGLGFRVSGLGFRV
jgi:hypothetical protein